MQELRVQKAKELLAGSTMIQDIWASVGFNNRNTFIRAFRKIEGFSSMEYRLQHVANPEEGGLRETDGE
ncbi:helix-turn-helix domain-containing protein [Paenibacillus zanthoxyli]|uniref:helix-turn-helix domain-containing protein n=1 Tax=Paenibacillus zanthoxyli TaxID=369399 RepID=UPI0004724A5D|nr:helix-turn-helix domain-containing protein [Paenibacillus zanthoxyli]